MRQGARCARGQIGRQFAMRLLGGPLPQTVAAFHSLVGLAASFTAISDYFSALKS